MSGRYEKKKEKQPLGWKKTMLIIIAVLLVLIVAVAIAGVVYYNSMLNRINKVVVPEIEYTEATTEATEAPTEEATEATTEATTVATEPHIASSEDYINFLVVGQAARNDETERFADTTILCTLNTYEKTLTMTSMLRDTLVQQPVKYGTHTLGGIKLTTVYHLGYQWAGNDVAGSMAVMNQTLYNNFGIEVDYNFEVDFDAFIKIVDLLDGVEIELTEAEANYLNDDDFWVYYDVEPGLQRLDGMCALSYARMRKAEGDGESDINRTARQRKLITAIIDKLKTRSLSDLQELANSVLPYITTSMTNAEITDMLLTVLPMIFDLEIKSGGTCPANYSGDVIDIYNDGNPDSILRFNEKETKEYMRAITEGEGVIGETAE